MSDFVDSLTSAHMDAAPAQPQDTRLVQNLRRASIFIPLSMLLIGMFITALHWYMTRGGADIPMESPDFVNNIVTLHAIERLGGTDSWNPMLAVRDWLWSNPDSDAYEHFFFGLGTKFQYPLTSLLALQWLPLGGTSDIRFLNILAVLAWISIAPGMMLLDLQLARLLTLPGQRDGRLWLMACAALGTLCFYPLMRAVYLGQIQIFLDALFVFACYFLARGQSRWAGILIGLSALVKPQMALFLLWGAVRRDLAFIGGAGICCVLGYFLSGVLYGWAWPVSYLHVLGFIGQHGESFYANQSLNGLLNRLIGNGPNLIWDAQHFAPYNAFVHILTLFFTLAMLTAALWVARMAMTPLAGITSFMIAALCFTAASPVAWEHHYGILLPLFSLVFMALLRNGRETTRRGMLWGLLAVTFTLCANSLAPLNFLADTPLNIVQSYLFIAALGVAVLAFMLRRDLGWPARG
ncbi:glycosyltransferase family 87 protein [Komagataeibacter sp. FNDCR2]|uniref:glycosyltransferase family 87 protein n=1 Tax=Komagataeibacter sp. FNDCR2 TaxID=2878682 RepID=UPI001E2F88A2|nr:glycosyltransferase family 87 protein [Komagataeibacter sp. FNDCR2]MCE2574213.1 DUF2029 domain-containing protein [Komagataeibacter sp. FNDCR2]